MAKDKKMVEAITSMEEDFAQWYTDVVKKAELVDYTSVKGCMVIKPAGYAIWENIQHELDRRFKETGVENVYLPMFIPESLLQKEKDPRQTRKNSQARRLLIPLSPSCTTEKHCSQAPATTLATDLPGHLTFSIQTRTTH